METLECLVKDTAAGLQKHNFDHRINQDEVRFFNQALDVHNHLRIVYSQRGKNDSADLNPFDVIHWNWVKLYSWAVKTDSDCRPRHIDLHTVRTLNRYNSLAWDLKQVLRKAIKRGHFTHYFQSVLDWEKINQEAVDNAEFDADLDDFIES
jgi:hypothetical protein